jgi:hypothetical protein
MFTHVKALEAYLQTEGGAAGQCKMPVRGRRRDRKPEPAPFIARNAQELAADVAVMSDAPLGPGRPAINAAVRGALYLELEVRGPRHDLHSGNFGGAVCPTLALPVPLPAIPSAMQVASSGATGMVLASPASASRHRSSCMSGFSPSRETIAQPRTLARVPPNPRYSSYSSCDPRGSRSVTI